jgi:hypothetical protein
LNTDQFSEGASPSPPGASPNSSPKRSGAASVSWKCQTMTTESVSPDASIFPSLDQRTMLTEFWCRLRSQRQSGLILDASALLALPETAAVAEGSMAGVRSQI